MAMKTILPLVGFLGLAACGGGGGLGTCTTNDLSGGPATITQLAADTRCYDILTRNGSLTVVEPTAITSNASFDGVMNINDNGVTANTGWTGQVALTYNAGTDALSGNATNFFQTGIDSQGFQNNPIETRNGNITFSGTSGAGSTFPVAVGGNFNPTSSSGTGAAISGSGTGAFFGPDATTPTTVVISNGTFSQGADNYQFEVVAD